MTRAKALLASLALLTAPLAFAPAAFGDGAAFAAEPTASTTIPDSTYGEGGTKQSLSNDRRELMAEVWRDNMGIIREQFELDPDGSQFWGFFVGEGTSAYSWGGAIAIRPIGGPTGRFQMTIYGSGNVTIKEYGFLDKAELDTEFAHWHSQMRGWINGFIRPAQGGNG